MAKLRGIVGQKKIGHTGTLDPDAEGVLPVCLGRATKVCDMLTEKDKTYEAVLLLGKETDTQDISGTVLRVGETEGLTQEQVKDCVMSFVGEYDQIPPMYSAPEHFFSSEFLSLHLSVHPVPVHVSAAVLFLLPTASLLP